MPIWNMQFSADADIYGQNSDAYDANKRYL